MDREMRLSQRIVDELLSIYMQSCTGRISAVFVKLSVPKQIVVIKGWFIKAAWGVFACFAPQFGLKMCCNDHSSTPNIAKKEKNHSYKKGLRIQEGHIGNLETNIVSYRLCQGLKCDFWPFGWFTLTTEVTTPHFINMAQLPDTKKAEVLFEN